MDVAAAIAAIEIVPFGMMLRMLASPARKGGEGAQAAQPADDRIGPAGGEERAVSAIVLNDEHAHHERAGRHGERKGKPRGIANSIELKRLLILGCHLSKLV